MTGQEREYISVPSGTQQNPNQGRTAKKKSLLFTALIAILVMFVLFVVVIFMAAIEEGNRESNELWLYGVEEYYKVFDSSSAVEDNILLVFLADENDFDCDDYSTTGVVGDNVYDDIRLMFDDYGEYDDAMYAFFDDVDYADNLSTGYVNVISRMTDIITASDFVENFYYYSDRSNLAASRVINKTDIAFDEDSVTAELERFTKKTGIPCVLLIEYEQNVYKEEDSVYTDIAVALVMLMLAMIPVTVIIAVVTFLKGKNGNPPSGPRVTGRGFAEKCNKDGCDGRIRRDERPPWEYD